MPTTPDDTVLLTGAAGFIGFHLASRLLDEGAAVTGVDNLSAYYSRRLKQARLDRLTCRRRYTHWDTDLAHRERAAALFERVRPSVVVHLAAQPGVRYSLENPHAYVDANLVAFMNVLEGCRHGGVRHLVYASSSSVYGLNRRMPFSIHDNVDHPVSLYAATKKANELMAHTYSHLYRLPTTGLRFFTVYGPWGRPDMSPILFARAILQGRPIEVFNHGNMRRDFTYVDDVVEGVRRVMDHLPQPNPRWSGEAPDPGTSAAPYRVYNIGNTAPVALMDFIATLEAVLGREAEKVFQPMQPGDVPETFADVDDLVRDVGFRPSTPLADGLARFAAWMREHGALLDEGG
jgi:UDP-glucuronate 4-epimerase